MESSLEKCTSLYVSIHVLSSYEAYAPKLTCFLCRYGDMLMQQNVKKGKMTEDAAKKELEEIKKRIKFTSAVEDLKDVDLVVEVRRRSSRSWERDDSAL